MAYGGPNPDAITYRVRVPWSCWLWLRAAQVCCWLGWFGGVEYFANRAINSVRADVDPG